MSKDDDILDVLGIGDNTPKKPQKKNDGDILDLILDNGPQPDTGNAAEDFIREHRIDDQYALRRSDRNILLLPKLHDLITLSDDQKKLYEKALDHIGITQRCETYSIDKRGDCIELREMMGGDFLGDHVIVVSPHQQQCAILSKSYSYEDGILNKLYSEWDSTIKSFTMHEPLVGKIHNPAVEMQFPRFIQWVHECKYTQETVELSLRIDTPTKAVSSFAKLVDAFKAYERDRDLLVSPGYVQTMRDLAEPLKLKHGNLTALNEPKKNMVYAALDSFMLIEDDQDTIMFLREGKPVFLFYSKEGSTHQEGANEQCVIVNGVNTSKVIDVMCEYNLFGYDTALAEHRMHVIERGLMGESKSHGLEDVLTNKKQMPMEWQRLKRAVKKIEHSDDPDEAFKSLSPETKMQFVYVKNGDPLAYVVLARSKPNPLLQQYLGNGEEFEAQFAAATNNAQRAMLDELLDTMVYTHHNNTQVNAWLQKNYSDLCDDMGIVFQRP